MILNDRLMAILIMSASVLLQVAAAYLSLRLIRITGVSKAWVLIALAILLQTIRRLIALSAYIAGDISGFVLADDFIGLMVSAFMLAGVATIAPLFMSLKGSEEAMRESEEKYRSLFEESKDAVFMSTPEGKFLDINTAGVELFGYASREELLKINLDRDLYINPEDRKRYRLILHENGFVKDYEIGMKRKDAQKLVVISTASVVRDKSGRISAYRGIMRDITSYKKLEEQLLQSQKMEAVGQLAGGIAHDFNNILCAITGYASLLLIKTRDDLTKTYADQILALSDKAASLTQSLLAFSRKQIINPKPADINEIVRSADRLLTRLVEENIELKTMLSDAAMTVFVDQGQIEQVLINLANNARDAMPDGGTLTISTEPAALDKDFIDICGPAGEGDYALIAVSDTGMGMEEKTRERIFEPFYTTKEVGKGTGLGLAMVYGIIKQHNGFINVYSEPGKGTMFRIYLPVISQKAEEPQAANRPALKGGIETILLAEDALEVRITAKAILEEFGYRVIEAADGDEAIREFVHYKDEIDFLITDVIMPKKNGMEVYREIQKLKPGIKVLFTSGYTAEIVRKQGLLEDGLELISKPVLLKELLTKIREILDR